MRYLVLAALAVASQGCVSGASNDLRLASLNVASTLAAGTGRTHSELGEEATTDLALAEVRNLLRDPESAQFRDVRMVDYQGGKLVCGEVNGKNGFGGYVGFKPFLAGFGGAMLYSASEYASVDQAANAGLVAACG